MYRDKLRQLANLIRKQEHYKEYISGVFMSHTWEGVPSQFTLVTVHNDGVKECQSVGCIIGYGLGLDGGYDVEGPAGNTFKEFARRYDLSRDITRMLCDPMHHVCVERYEKITPEDAAEAIDHVIGGADTEEQIWRHISAKS